MEILLKWLSVAALAAFKVWPAVGLGIGYKQNFLEMFLTLAVGGLFTIVVMAVFGSRLREWMKERRRRKHHNKKKVNIRRARKILRLWKKFGIWGVAFLTPPLLSPPIGTAIAIAFRETPKRIILFIGGSMVAWAAVFALMGKSILHLIGLE